MFDYMIKILPNGRLLVRNSHSKTSETINATEISSFFEKALEEQIEAKKKQDDKQREIREGALKL